LLKYYTGNNTGDTPGNLPDPYFWWEAGAMFGTMIDYWFLTGDTSYNEATTQAMLHQASPSEDFMPENQTRTLGNDDQGFWAMAAMSATENKFPDPPEDQPQWLSIVQAVFNQYASRWDTEKCNGGLRWQIFRFNNGFEYKNSISNGCFFNIAARLARYTGNQTYADWATKIFEWEEQVGLINPEGDVTDGITVRTGCSDRDTNQWSYNHGIFLHGAAYMYNFTDGAEAWKRRVDSILASTRRTFYTNDTSGNPILFEQFCEPRGFCDTDQRSFKGYLTRWMAGTTQMAPHTYDVINPLLHTNAVAAARVCNGNPRPDAVAAGEPPFRGIPGTACGFKWTEDTYRGVPGVGEQMNALSAVMYTLMDRVAAPVTADTGGTSRPNPAAGTEPKSPYREFAPITMGERVGAGFLTAALVLGVVGGSAFVVM